MVEPEQINKWLEAGTMAPNHKMTPAMGSVYDWTRNKNKIKS